MVNRPKGLGTSEATRRSEGENTVGRLLLVAQRYSGGPGRQPRPQARGGGASQGISRSRPGDGPCMLGTQIIPSQHHIAFYTPLALSLNRLTAPGGDLTPKWRPRACGRDGEGNRGSDSKGCLNRIGAGSALRFLPPPQHPIEEKAEWEGAAPGN